MRHPPPAGAPLGNGKWFGEACSAGVGRGQGRTSLWLDPQVLVSGGYVAVSLL
eukprot:CAMPEP_0182905180 /NCGR_PEP_ID=MMETSP0034_2-20130328/32740_1 /TAXON_ID=156128 /ORGANISM="Nephroselmis pyriformis, Strain CCMP717" /LENGTH=52 /DNA_ID=CAMNT_0025040535 /DNA_START=121 /DNA_END=276 /DNA_ORIENTATION=+